MKTAIVGYPRIGAHRELKFASEQYFRGACTEAELQETAKALRLANLTQQKESGLDWIPSNDFSFYDGMLDTAFLLNAVPKRYRELGLAPLDTYFAAARGYQGDKGDVKALAMKKWFNTNYHYMVPELEDDTVICLADEKPFNLYQEAKAAGVETKTGCHWCLYVPETGCLQRQENSCGFRCRHCKGLYRLAPEVPDPRHCLGTVR